MSAGQSRLKRTPLYDRHVALGARVVSFGGWEMPLSYRGIIEEHRNVRQRAGLFDVSHMGEIAVEGPGAADLCQHLTTNDVALLADGVVQYTILCNENGGVIDDVTLYRRSASSYFFCVNAANTASDYEWIKAHAGGASVYNVSDETALLSLQGPLAEVILERLAGSVARELKRFRFSEGEIAGRKVTISRTGYTGEDGFELFAPASAAERLWQALLEGGRDQGLLPVGLGARDTLRLEAALPLYGNELSPSTSPLEAGLDRFICLAAADFIGAKVLREQEAKGLKRRLVGLELLDQGIPRHGYEVLDGEKQCGEVTSGTKSPTLGKSIALAYIDAGLATAGRELYVLIRGRRVRAKVVPTPFYRRPRRS